MDTGSSDLWVPAANCRSQACQVHTTLGSNDSSTLQATTQLWQIQYGTGGAAGVLIADTVVIGGLTVKRMPFGAATQLSNNFARFVMLVIGPHLHLDARWYFGARIHGSECPGRRDGHGSTGICYPSSSDL